MGDIAESMLDGTVCQMCGEWMGGSNCGYPVTCAGCGGEPDDEGEKCPYCKSIINIDDLPNNKELSIFESCDINEIDEFKDFQFDCPDCKKGYIITRHVEVIFHVFKYDEASNA